MHPDLGGYKPSDIQVVVAFDIDRRKVGKPLEQAMFALPNCTKTIMKRMPKSGVRVMMGEVLDGISEHMSNYPVERAFQVSKEKPVDVVSELKRSRAEILMCYLPVGSEEAVRFYAGACLEAGVSLINCMPVFIVSEGKWARRFEAKGIPIIGDDVKSQLGATILHRVVTALFVERGVRMDRTYQLNVGGNTDFLNMMNQERLKSKKISKTEAVRAQIPGGIASDCIHIGPSDYVPWLNDNKVCFLRMEGRGYGGVPLELEARLSVEDSPNSGGITVDAIRCCRIARDRGIGGPLLSISAYAMKHPPRQINDQVARRMVEEFIQGKRER
jgi:myo-inositol-1-phosphate synthase